ncbi:NUDIX domain-containing protein [Psychrobacillus sp. FSL K6-2836]|uniref:NUDIX domain-containing protein n=1 Tax=Psychrobacillus sp. FSL K6-2836 TaxID=2921548 RepID=UPI0030F59CA0
MFMRNSAKAVIIKDDKLLTIKLYENDETYYILPGGGQEPGENLQQTIERECMEELGAEVTIGELLFVREYIGKNHELSAKHGKYHQIEFMFLCSVDRDRFENGVIPDQGQVGIEWLSIQSLMEHNFFPKALRVHIISYLNNGKAPIYVGDIN